jgi:hypothetical protein
MSILASAWASRGHKVTIVTYDKGCPAFYTLHPEVTVQKLRLSGGSMLKRIGNHFRRIPTLRRGHSFLPARPFVPAEQLAAGQPVYAHVHVSEKTIGFAQK